MLRVRISPAQLRPTVVPRCSSMVERRKASGHNFVGFVFLEGGPIMANKSLFSSVKSLLRRADARNEAGGAGLQLAAEARAGAARCDGLLQRHVLRQGRRSARNAEDARRPGRRQRLPGQAGGLQPRARAHEGHAGGAAARAVEARYSAVPPGVRPRRGQRPRVAHAVADDPLGPVRPQEPVVRAAAGRSALAECRIG